MLLIVQVFVLFVQYSENNNVLVKSCQTPAEMSVLSRLLFSEMLRMITKQKRRQSAVLLCSCAPAAQLIGASGRSRQRTCGAD